MCVFSPLALLAWIGVSARVTNIGRVEIMSDPPEFESRLEPFTEFVNLARRLEAVGGGTDGWDKRYRILVEAGLLVRKLPPAPHAVRYGVTMDTDVRRPIFEAQELLRRNLTAGAQKLLAEQEAAKALDLMITNVYASSLFRYADVASHARGSNTTSSTVERIRAIASRLPAEKVEHAVRALLEIESEPDQFSSTIKRDFELCVARNRRKGAGWEISDLNHILGQAFRLVRRGESVAPLIKRVSEWTNSREQQSAWAVLSSWELARIADLRQRKKLRQTVVELQAVLLTKRGIDPRTVPNLGLPTDVTHAPLGEGQVRLDVTNTQAQLLFSSNDGDRKESNGH